MEGLTLTVADVKRSIAYYRTLGFDVEIDAAPPFALMRGGGGTIGLLSANEAAKDGGAALGSPQAKSIHVELSTDDLDGLYTELTRQGVTIDVPPHDEPWERSMTAFDPDGYSVEFAQGRRGEYPT